MNEIKLKPCPFCGSSRVCSRPYSEREDGKPWHLYYVHCDNCATDGPIIRTRGLDVPSETARNASIALCMSSLRNAQRRTA